MNTIKGLKQALNHSSLSDNMPVKFKNDSNDLEFKCQAITVKNGERF